MGTSARRSNKKDKQKERELVVVMHKEAVLRDKNKKPFVRAAVQPSHVPHCVLFSTNLLK